MKDKPYIKSNQAAWEEAYDQATPAYKDIVSRLKVNPSTYIPPRIQTHLDPLFFKGKDIAQLACNNGREIISIGLTHEANSITGFDLASNMIEAATQSAAAFDLNAAFYQRDILNIEPAFNARFDAIFILIGVLCWIDDLDALMGGVARLLKPGGTLYLYDGHPLTHVFAFPQDDGYIKEHPYTPVHSYFRKTPFVEFEGMGYLTGKTYQSKAPFTSFLYTFEVIFKALINHNLRLTRFEEGSEDALANFPDLNNGPFPLTFYLNAKKEVR